LARTAASCRLLTLFAVLPRGAQATSWEPDADGWTIATEAGRFTARVEGGALAIRRDDEAEAWSIPLPSAAASEQ
jgi:outer membrane protein assembly factor BamB